MQHTIRRTYRINMCCRYRVGFAIDICLVKYASTRVPLRPHCAGGEGGGGILAGHLCVEGTAAVAPACQPAICDYS